MNTKTTILASLIAILAVSVATTYMATSQPAIADHIAAKKATVGASLMEVSAMATTGGGTVTTEATLAEYYIKSNTYGDWLVDFTAECATMTQVEGKGKMTTLEGAQAGAKLWLELDGVPVPISSEDLTDNKWNFCEQNLQIKTTLNDLIVKCTADQAAAGLCTEGQLVFLCDVDPVAALSGECQQAVELYLKTAGTHNAKWILMNVPNGVHEVEIKALLSAGPSSGGEVADDIPNGALIKATAMIGKRVVVAETIHVMNDATI